MNAPTVTPDKVTAARTEVERLCQVEREWSARRRELATNLADLVARSGDSVLDAALADDGDATARALAGQIAKLRAEVETTESTIAAARSRRLKAIPAVAEAEAEALRGQAVELRLAADEREPKTRELLAAVEEWEGCEYAPKAPTRQSGPAGGQIGGPMTVVRVPTPRTAQLRQQADILDRQALEAERREPVNSGTVTVADLAELEAAIFADPMRRAPAMADVERWYGAVTHAEEERRVRHRAVGGEDYTGRRIEYTLSWRNAVIVPEQSAPALGR